MQVRNRFPVHSEGDQRFVFEGLGDRNASRDDNFRGLATRVQISPGIPDVDRVLAQADGLEHVTQPNSRPFRASNGPRRPLVAGGTRAKFRATITAAFELELIGVGRELALQISDRKTTGVFDRLAADLEFPIVRAHRQWWDSVVANEEPGGGRYEIVEQMGRCFRTERAIVKNHETRFFAGDLKGLRRGREGGWD